MLRNSASKGLLPTKDSSYGKFVNIVIGDMVGSLAYVALNTEVNIYW